jgi:hypothetical protein
MLIRQCRERERASARVSRPKAYLRRDEILKGIAKLKSGKMGNIGVNMPWWHMMGYGLTKMWTSYFRIAKNSIFLWYIPYTHFKKKDACIYGVQPSNIIMHYCHFLSWSVMSLVWVILILVQYYPIRSNFACHKRNNSCNNRDYSLKLNNLSQFNKYGLYWFGKSCRIQKWHSRQIRHTWSSLNGLQLGSPFFLFSVCASLMS